LNGDFSRKANRRHRRTGHLFNERFAAVPIEEESHLLEACRYVVLNPVRAGLCARPEDWFWSGFATSCGLARTFPFVDASLVVATLGATPANAAHLLRALVRD
ncbi:MAG: transposase, partial [Gaiellaceae bacterium]